VSQERLSKLTLPKNGIYAITEIILLRYIVHGLVSFVKLVSMSSLMSLIPGPLGVGSLGFESPGLSVAIRHCVSIASIAPSEWSVFYPSQRCCDDLQRSNLYNTESVCGFVADVVVLFCYWTYS